MSIRLAVAVRIDLGADLSLHKALHVAVCHAHTEAKNQPCIPKTDSEIEEKENDIIALGIPSCLLAILWEKAIVFPDIIGGRLIQIDMSRAQ